LTKPDTVHALFSIPASIAGVQRSKPCVLMKCKSLDAAEIQRMNRDKVKNRISLGPFKSVANPRTSAPPQRLNNASTARTSDLNRSTSSARACHAVALAKAGGFFPDFGYSQ
jgi:hypothetical protein